jgi:hypothetical protein
MTRSLKLMRIAKAIYVSFEEVKGEVSSVGKRVTKGP